jgi:hypothetical protein
MIIQKMFKYPLLIIAVLFMYLLWNQIQTGPYRDRFRASSCKAALVKFKRKAPQEWQWRCHYKEEDHREELTLVMGQTTESLQKIVNDEDIYKLLGNGLYWMAQEAAEQFLYIDWVIVELEHQGIRYSAYATGKKVLTLQEIKDPELLKQFFNGHVKVQKRALNQLNK